MGDPDSPEDEKDATHFYSLLENEVIPTYYNHQERWISIMKEAIKTGVNFTAHRMVKKYNEKYY